MDVYLIFNSRWYSVSSSFPILYFFLCYAVLVILITKQHGWSRKKHRVTVICEVIEQVMMVGWKFLVLRGDGAPKSLLIPVYLTATPVFYNYLTFFFLDLKPRYTLRIVISRFFLFLPWCETKELSCQSLRTCWGGFRINYLIKNLHLIAPENFE